MSDYLLFNIFKITANPESIKNPEIKNPQYIPKLPEHILFNTSEKILRYRKTSPIIIRMIPIFIIISYQLLNSFVCPSVKKKEGSLGDAQVLNMSQVIRNLILGESVNSQCERELCQMGQPDTILSHSYLITNIFPIYITIPVTIIEYPSIGSCGVFIMASAIQLPIMVHQPNTIRIAGTDHANIFIVGAIIFTSPHSYSYLKNGVSEPPHYCFSKQGRNKSEKIKIDKKKYLQNSIAGNLLFLSYLLAHSPFLSVLRELEQDFIFRSVFFPSLLLQTNNEQMSNTLLSCSIFVTLRNSITYLFLSFFITAKNNKLNVTFVTNMGGFSLKVFVLILLLFTFSDRKVSLPLMEVSQ